MRWFPSARTRSGNRARVDPSTTTGRAPSASSAEPEPGIERRPVEGRRIVNRMILDPRLSILDFPRLQSGMEQASGHLRFEAVPLFPLPNVVLFPRAVLPLHIFEERYRAMMADALAGDRQVAMALLKPGWEKNYYARPAIEPVVCLGRILSHERLPDGCYNFLLQG